MKTLLLVRHAKSSWENSDLTDFERPLNKRGKRDAPFMAKLIAEMNIRPDLMISSPAERALTTARIFAGEFNIDPKKIIKDDRIYTNGLKNIINIISEIDNDVITLIVFGHNPDLSYLTGKISDKYIDTIPTCGVVCVDFDFISWYDIESVKGKLRFFEYPKKHITESNK